MPRVDAVIRQNISRPDFWLLNLNPATAERNNKDDLTAVVISWLMILIPIAIIGVVLFARK